jgi:serine/threonine protein phosphatase PrpC
VAGKLAVSRSFGDYTFKRNGVLVVNPGPQSTVFSLFALDLLIFYSDVNVTTLTPESEFVIVACDGLFESLQPDQIAEFIKQRLKVSSLLLGNFVARTLKNL